MNVMKQKPHKLCHAFVERVALIYYRNVKTEPLAPESCLDAYDLYTFVRVIARIIALHHAVAGSQTVKHIGCLTQQLQAIHKEHSPVVWVVAILLHSVHQDVSRDVRLAHTTRRCQHWPLVA